MSLLLPNKEMKEYTCDYCGNKLERDKTKLTCLECGRIAKIQTVKFTEDPEAIDMMPIFGFED